MQKTKPPHRLHLSAPPLRKYIQRSAVLCTLWRALGAAACAFALSGASLLGRPLPLVLAFLASVPWGVLNLSAFFGAAVGTVLFWGVSKGLTVLAAAFLLATESLIFRELLPREKHWLLPLSAAFFYALLAFFPLLAAHFPPRESIYCVFCAAVIGLCSDLFLSRTRMRMVLLLLGALLSASDVFLLGDLSLGVIAGAAVCCLFLDTENGVLCAAAVGLSLSMAPEEPRALTGAFLAAALGCAMQLPAKKWLKVPVFMGSCTAFCVFLGLLSVSDLVACLLGALLSLALPRRLAAGFSPEFVEPAQMQSQLLRAGRVFSQISTLLSPAEKTKSLTPSTLFDAVADEICRKCDKQSECWEKSSRDTYFALRSAAAKFLPRARAEEADFPPFFIERCQNFADFLSRCNEILLSFRKSSQYQSKLAEHRAVLQSQYASISRTLEKLSIRSEGNPPVNFRPEVGYRACGVRSSRISGDFGLSFENSGKFYLLLCDGMGTGLPASEQSEAAAGLLRQMILAGFLPQDAIETLGGIYALRENGVFSTVDLLQIDLSSAEGTLFKSGAAPSFLKVGRRVVRLGKGSPPPGLEAVTRCETIPVYLGGEATLALSSDGLDGDKIEQVLLTTRKTKPVELANELVAAAGSRSDDCSAAVVRFAELPHT